MPVRVITPPSVEPVSLALARLHCRLVASGSPASHPDDSLLETLIAAAREHVEAATGRALAPTVFELTLDRFPSKEIELPHPPLISVDEIAYTDTAGAAQTLSPTGYVVDDSSRDRAWVLPAADEQWPDTADEINAVRITYTAGYTEGTSPDTNPLPAPIKQAMLLLIAHWYTRRVAVTEGQLAEVPLAVSSLLAPYRRWGL